MSGNRSARHPSRHQSMPPRSMIREVENGRDEFDRSRSTSPSLRAGQIGLGPSMLDIDMGDATAGNNASAHSL
eukprot:7751820-Prorocentrum_lima.AAC.1